MAIVIINSYEPHGEVASRLLELAAAKGHDQRLVEAQRGEHDAALSFRVPEDVAEEFNAERAERWPAPLADEMVDDDNDPSTPPVRKNRPSAGKTKE